MDKNDLYSQVNEGRHRESLPAISKKDFIAALSSLEAKGVIMSLGDQCWVKAPDIEVEIIEGG